MLKSRNTYMVVNRKGNRISMPIALLRAQNFVVGSQVVRQNNSDYENYIDKKFTEKQELKVRIMTAGNYNYNNTTVAKLILL